MDLQMKDLQTASMPEASLVAMMDKEQNNIVLPKRYEGTCKVCGRQFEEVLRDGRMQIGCPTNNKNHWEANELKEEKYIETTTDVVVNVVMPTEEKPKKKSKKV
jgi:hypothetical protein